MILHLTSEQMLERWRVHRGLYPLAGPEMVSASLPDTLDAVLQAEIEAWYDGILATAPASKLAPAEIAGSITLEATEPSGGHIFSLPEGVVRLVSVRLDGWDCDARIIADPCSAEARMQRHRFTRAGASAPVAVLHPGGVVSLYPYVKSRRALSVRVVGRTDSLYHFDDSLLPMPEEL